MYSSHNKIPAQYSHRPKTRRTTPIFLKTVAYELGINQKTVDFHRANILEKMETDSVVEPALLTHEAQLV